MNFIPVNNKQCHRIWYDIVQPQMDAYYQQLRALPDSQQDTLEQSFGELTVSDAATAAATQQLVPLAGLVTLRPVSAPAIPDGPHLINWSSTLRTHIHELCSDPLDIHYEICGTFFKLMTQYLTQHIKIKILPQLYAELHATQLLQRRLLQRTYDLPPEVIDEVGSYLLPGFSMSLWGRCWRDYKVMTYNITQLLRFLNSSYMSLNDQACFLYRSLVFEKLACKGVDRWGQDRQFKMYECVKSRFMEHVQDSSLLHDDPLLQSSSLVAQSFLLIDANTPPHHRQTQQMFVTHLEPRLLSSAAGREAYKRITECCMQQLEAGNWFYLSNLERIDVTRILSAHNTSVVKPITPTSRNGSPQQQRRNSGVAPASSDDGSVAAIANATPASLEVTT